MPTWTGALVTVAAPVVPLIGVGPAADNVQAVGGCRRPGRPVVDDLDQGQRRRHRGVRDRALHRAAGRDDDADAGHHAALADPGARARSRPDRSPTGRRSRRRPCTALTPPGVVGSPLPDTGPWPVMATGVAVSVQSAGTLPDPVAAGSTTFVNVRCAGWSVLVIVHVALSPRREADRAGRRIGERGTGAAPRGRQVARRTGLGERVEPDRARPRSVIDGVTGAALDGHGARRGEQPVPGRAVPPERVHHLLHEREAGWDGGVDDGAGRRLAGAQRHRPVGTGRHPHARPGRRACSPPDRRTRTACRCRRRPGRR